MAGIFNCDWFSFTVDLDKYLAEENPSMKTTLDPEINKQLATLFKTLDEQRDKPNGGYVDLGLFKFDVYPNGSRRYYYILHNDDFELQLARYRSNQEDNYPVYIHFKSQFLWSDLYGLTALQDKYKLVIEWLEQMTNCKYKSSKINRLDLCYHCDDIPPGFTADHFVGRHTLDDTIRSHRIVTGINIGSRKSEKLYLRCYNKYLELRASKKNWFYMIWQSAGLNIKKVWNVEFQMKREFFRETEIDGRIYDTAEQVIEAMHPIWLYLTTEWISYRVPDDVRRARWSLHPWWLTLYDFVETDVKIERKFQRELPLEEAVVPALRGYMTTFAARTGLSLHDGSLFKRILDAIYEYDKRTDREFDETANIKKSLMDPEGWQPIQAKPKEMIQVPDKTKEPEPLIEHPVPADIQEEVEQLRLAIDVPADYSRFLKKLNDKVDLKRKKEAWSEASDTDLQK